MLYNKIKIIKEQIDVVQKIKACLGQPIPACLGDPDDSFRNSLGVCRKRIHKVIEAFQKALANNLAPNSDLKEITEFSLFEKSRDKADIRLESYQHNGKDYELIIEIDATRADQVAKKMLSRFCHSLELQPSKPLFYIALLYQGTTSMNPDECIKYFNMGATVLRHGAAGVNNILMGYIIHDDESKDEVYIWENANSSHPEYNEVRASYTDYLIDQGIHAIQNYLMPVNKICSLDLTVREAFEKDLNNKSNDYLDVVREKFGSLTKDQRSYWKKYIEYLRSHETQNR